MKAQVKSKQYQIFDLYVLKKWPIAKITATLGVNFGQVYLAKRGGSGSAHPRLAGLSFAS